MATNYLVLEDGTVLEGEAFGSERTFSGEVVFNTAMGGYQEIITDPSCCDQILISTYPLIGNYGITDTAYQSERAWVGGLVVREYCKDPSPMYGGRRIDDFLKEQGIPAISGIDTRELTLKIRNGGTLRGSIVIDASMVDDAIESLKGPYITDRSPVSRTSCKARYSVDNGKDVTVGVIDCGLMNSIRDSLSSRYDLEVFPYDTPAQAIIDSGVRGVVVGNGPGDPSHPELMRTVVDTVKELSSQTAILGLCLGSQTVALALGGSTYKMRYGHRGASQPVRCGNRVFITTQNHGFAVDGASLEGTGLVVERVNVNDGSVEGAKHKDLPIITCQYHPEFGGFVGDSETIFEEFTRMMGVKG